MRSVRGQFAPAVACQHSIDRRERHRLAQSLLDFLLQRWDDNDPAAHCALEDFIENLRFALPCRIGAIAQGSLGSWRLALMARHLAVARAQIARRSD